MNRILKNIFIGLISFLLLLSTIIVTILWTFSNNIPDYKFLKITSLQFQAKFIQEMVIWLQIFLKKKEFLFHSTQYPKM